MDAAATIAQTRAHSSHRFVNYFEQESRAFAEPFTQFEVANGEAVEHEMILRLEVNDVGDVRGGRALSLLSVTKTGTRRANRFGLLCKSVAVQRPRTELLQQERGALRLLPQPIVDRCQRRSGRKIVGG